MTDNIARVCLIMGSPAKGNTNRLVGLIEQGVLEGGVFCDVFSLADSPVLGCDDCGSCLATGECIKTAQGLDNMAAFDAMLDEADLLVIVTPVFFAGPPSQLKAVYDRFQPRWARRYRMGEPAPAKRPAMLFVLGGGDDPFGYEPLVTITRSALNIAGFRLGEIHDFVGFGQPKQPTRMNADAVRLGRVIATRAATAVEARRMRGNQ